jgi:hypothetical protein
MTGSLQLLGSRLLVERLELKLDLKLKSKSNFNFKSRGPIGPSYDLCVENLQSQP